MPPSPFLQIQDELLEEIFLRLPAAADLARASMASASFHRVITNHTFLRRFRTIHPPHLLGIISETFIPAQTPHPSAAAARAFIGFDFSFSFLPSGDYYWCRHDFRDGRALFCSIPDGVLDDHCNMIMDLVVCDPLYCRYLVLPAIPDDLAAPVHRPEMIDFEPFLAPVGENEEDPLSFKVMCLAVCRTKLVLFVFSSSAWQWRAITFDGWSSITEGLHLLSEEPELLRRQYAHRCFCWQIQFTEKLLMLDTCRMEFSTVDLPPDLENRQFSIVEADKGRFGMLTLSYDDMADQPIYLSYSVLRNDQWKLEKEITMPIRCCYYILGVAGGYLLLEGLYTMPSQEKLYTGYFSVNIKTLKVELLTWLSRTILLPSLLYACFPPSLSPPTI